ncbi:MULTISPECIES: spore germination protein [Pontibacillus]|uniref:Spore germination protein n=1 Tax=Pontibacillus chungwhensis TaxID=265426 RepID=A0ABY8UTM4_9BACI|nr:MULTISPECIES: spore germination protein [Pontibacillus]MCD5323486.1 spore germination protein [Pontibacillus sp. HN14]WIF96862.1 spore germination protein [Pontibacillus chungwhensis]
MRKYLNRLLFQHTNRNTDNASVSSEESPLQEERLTGELSNDIKTLQSLLGNSFDLKIVQFTCEPYKYEGAFLFIEELTETLVIHEQLKAVRSLSETTFLSDLSPEIMRKEVLTISESAIVDTLHQCISNLLLGNTLILSHSFGDGIILNSRKMPQRTIQPPSSESVVRGPRDGFVETLLLNIGLVRKRLKDPDLQLDYFKVGERSKTDVVVMSINGLTNPSIVEDVKNRLNKIDIDSVQESGVIEQLIEENSLSPFPQVQVTERPDTVAGSLAEGRVAIIVDHTPFVLIAPLTINSFYQSAEDYYERWIYSSLIRILRIGAAIIALCLPALYVALISYHQGLIPTDLVISLAGSREGVPFPSIVEALLMEVTIEILREAGIRLPNPVGQAVGIVGGLVIGESAVSAGLVSPMMVIVVALTAISSFALPQYYVGVSLRILRFPLMVSAALLGLYGIVIALILLSIHLIRLKSFGVYYLEPLVPYTPSGWKDMFIRTRTKRLIYRPEMLNPEDKKRMGTKN